MGTTPAWQVRFFGKFELRSPQGSRIDLPTRKAEALIAALVLNRKYGFDRDKLGKILWPDAEDRNRRASLRQTLALIRKAAGPDLLNTQGQTCRISEGCLIVSDYDDQSLRRGDLFMPDHEGDWFDQVRLEGKVDLLLKPSPIDSFYQMLLWLSDREPTKMLGLLRESPSFFEGLPFEAASRLLQKLPTSSTMPGWADFFIGRHTLGQNILVSYRHMRKAALAASNHGDKRLLVGTLSELVTLSILLNRLDEAQTFVTRLSEISVHEEGEFGRAAKTRAQALVLLHSGAKESGARLLSRAQDECSDAFEAATVQSLRAFFHATYGNWDEAKALNAQPKRLAEETGHSMLSGVCELTEASIAVAEADADSVMHTLERLSIQASAISNRHFKIYLKESIGMRYLQEGRIHLASRTSAEVRKLRNSLSMAYTPWDEMRLAPKG